eukprot:5854960-Prymnesium_polylepis.1
MRSGERARATRSAPPPLATVGDMARGWSGDGQGMVRGWSGDLTRGSSARQGVWLEDGEGMVRGW